MFCMGLFAVKDIIEQLVKLERGLRIRFCTSNFSVSKGWVLFQPVCLDGNEGVEKREKSTMKGRRDRESKCSRR